MTVSIVIPTYNVAAYLLRCLECVNQQTFTDYEAIVIIDGATDDSYAIAADFCKTHEKFKVFRQDNKGSGPARNNGIRHSTGKFITFIDPDDWISPDYLKHLVEKQAEKDYDLTISYRTAVYFDVSGQEKKRKSCMMVESSCDEYDVIRSSYYKYRSVICDPTCKLYKRSIIEENGVEFPSLRRSQDIVFNYRYYEYVKSIGVIHVSDYFYRIEYAERINRIRTDYYTTIEREFSDLQAMHKRLGIDFPVAEACTAELPAVNALFEAYTLRNEPYDVLLNNPTIGFIVDNARLSGPMDRLRNNIIKSRRSFAIRLLLNIIVRLKQK